MLSELRLHPLPIPRVSSIRLDSVSEKLQKITDRNLARFSNESREFRNRKEELKRSLMKRGASMSFEDATNIEPGRQRLLISLYLEYTAREDQSWLPAFEKNIANSVLGASGIDWNPAVRRLATQLFFTHFDRLPVTGRSRLCALLLEAYGNGTPASQDPVTRWQEHRTTLFSITGSHLVARQAEPDESLSAILKRFGIPKEGRFAESLRHLLLLNALTDCPLGEAVPALAEIESLKEERADASLLMGAAALEIMVNRVATEGNRRWQGDWSNWIIRLGCDPRYGRSTGEGARWWGWATPDQLNLAQQGITGLTLRFFIEFLRRSLEGTKKEPQFELRSRYLLALYEAGKIQEARLALNENSFWRLEAKFRDVSTVAKLSATTDETSMICLRCVDDIFIIEGTHAFGLRAFQKYFPVKRFWESPKRGYEDRELRVSPDDCPIFLRHDQGGNWISHFIRRLRNSFHVEWDDVHF